MSLNASGYRYEVNEDNALDVIIEDYINGTLHPNRYDNRAKRGDISANLTSPMDSTSTLLFNRPYDIVTTVGYSNWSFLSVLHWGENPNGQWTVSINWRNSNRGSAVLSNISVSLYGVSSIPSSVSSIPSQCHSDCARTKGCAAAGPQYCDACNSTLLRNATSLGCIQPSECLLPNKIASGYCYIPRDSPTESPTQSPSGSPSSGWSAIGNCVILFILMIVAFNM
ncbi:PREDICTED: proprotein convertase subtilisin/kexin type 4-like isoform X2 [Amphimedon queenslandica]|uniref:P/Homo B domain-containing protein n=1 Tax=Amphimedon queenslandica TaxID=400682 RepID=A0AAN0JV88_AMPQE|nr:PREDICTED: proprotein convertase subtilisin/kexin type 4-like isoform X2 [Amphimedon queenslandica]|eukprot:XP_019860828.1 PREDICTED: proprotein convertase subtilisin/kexin type 4-like isoform X2 [Amphimedon queenslandica]